MAKTVIGMFDTQDQAANAIDDLKSSGLQSDDIKMLQGDTDAQTIKKEGRSGAMEKLKGYLADMGLLKSNIGLTDDEASWYQNELKGGKVLVIARCDDNIAANVQAVLEANSGQGSASPGATQAPQRASGKLKGGVPVVKEDVEIGKQQVSTGSVRLYSRPVSQQVEKEVQLREQHAKVERHAVNRPATEADFQTQGKSMEVTETSEIPTVRKQARVIEEVTLSPEVTEHGQRVEATARGTEVQVERTGSNRPYQDYDPEFRKGFQSMYGNTGDTYESYAPAYRYGYDLAMHQQFRDYEDWNAMESQARRQWEQRNPGTWDTYKNAIRDAWQKTRSSFSQPSRRSGPQRTSKPA